jgi:hypothetical protein
MVPDPANPQSWNRFIYTLNNPVRYNDPSGHCAICNWSLSINYNLSSSVNAGLEWLGVNGDDVAKSLDVAAKVLDGVGLAIDTAVAAGDVIAAGAGALTGGYASYPSGGSASVITVPGSAAVYMGLYEAHPVTMSAKIAGNIAGSFSFFAALYSDIITGETNHSGSMNASFKEGVQFAHNTTIGRDTLTSGTLAGLGWTSPIGLTSAPLAAAAFANDYDKLYVGPFSNVPKSITLIDINIGRERLPNTNRTPRNNQRNSYILKKRLDRIR